MKRRGLFLVIIATALVAAVPVWAQQAAQKSTLTQPRISPHDTINVRIGRGGPMVMIVYGRPYSKDPNSGAKRKIWGTLVPFGQVWRMGSDEATLFITPIDLTMGDLAIPAGTYTLDMQPEADGTAKLIVNKQVSRWGIPYTAAVQKGELGRADMKKSTVDNDVDQFTIAMTPATDGATINATWETTQYSVDFKIKK